MFQTETSQREARGKKGAGATRHADTDHQRLKVAGAQSQEAEAPNARCVIDVTGAMAMLTGSPRMDLVARNQRMALQANLLRLHLQQRLVWHQPLVAFQATRLLWVIGHRQWTNGAAHCITFRLNGCPFLPTMATTCVRRANPIMLHMAVLHL